MFLVGDIGGTTTRLARADVRAGTFSLREPARLDSRSAPQLSPLVAQYLERSPGPVRAAAFGIAGPVRGRTVRTTNLPWEVRADDLEQLVGAPVVLLNDLEAAAHGVLVVPAEELVTLQRGESGAGARAVIAAGTGLGEAILFPVDGGWRAAPSEGGHADFAPLDEEDVELWRWCRARAGRVSYEMLVSGPGLARLYAFQRERLGQAADATTGDEQEAPACVTRAAASGADPAASAAVRRFCVLYGAEAGNLALKALALGGVYLAGGVAPNLVDELRRGGFIAAFGAKHPHENLMRQIPVHLVVAPELGLLGAARAASLAGR